jgi:hypothetical protein
MNLGDFVGVSAFRMRGANPLAPAVEVEAAVLARLRAGECGVSDEDQMGLEAVLGKRPRELGDAYAEPAGLRVGLVGSFEGEEDELEVVGGE